MKNQYTLTQEQKAFVTSKIEEKWSASFSDNARKTEAVTSGKHSYYVPGFMIKSMHVWSTDLRELFLIYCYHMEKRKLEALAEKFGI